jgi:hypothetical protein
MKKVFLGGSIGLFAGGLVMLYFGWVFDSIPWRLFSPGGASLDVSPGEILLLIQCLLTGAFSGSIVFSTGRLGLGFAAGAIVGYGIGFLFMGHADPPWDVIGALSAQLPIAFVGVLSVLAANLMRMRGDIYQR